MGQREATTRKPRRLENLPPVSRTRWIQLRVSQRVVPRRGRHRRNRHRLSQRRRVLRHITARPRCNNLDPRNAVQRRRLGGFRRGERQALPQQDPLFRHGQSLRSIDSRYCRSRVGSLRSLPGVGSACRAKRREASIRFDATHPCRLRPRYIFHPTAPGSQWRLERSVGSQLDLRNQQRPLRTCVLPESRRRIIERPRRRGHRPTFPANCLRNGKARCRLPPISPKPRRRLG